ncbi:hypothetical protein [Sodalis sp. (in: enterobacteria)]|uniref:hypothetical protein n=1 Tax=Sodalis sp. (in: enterobacteria) TaxID=1898979 RepID=UPI003F6857C5
MPPVQYVFRYSPTAATNGANHAISSAAPFAIDASSAMAGVNGHADAAAAIGIIASS